MKKIAIFDFCETLVDFQTADAFVDYVREHTDELSVRRKEKINLILRKYKVTRIAEKITSSKYSIEKKLKLWQLKGLEKDMLNDLAFDFYQERIKPHLIERTNELLVQHQLAGDEVWLISGGYGIYLRYYKEEFKIDKLISSNISFSENKCLGKMEGLDCMRENKVELFKQAFSQCKGGKVIASYSDSISDIPILLLADRPYVISRRHQEWAHQYYFNEIIWTKNNTL